MSSAIRWVRAVLGTPGADAELTEAFWAGVTGFGLRRDPEDPVVTQLAPGTGDPYLRLVRLGRHSGRTLHLELTVKSVAKAIARAESLGGQVHRESDTLAQLVSPGGLGAVLVAGSAGRRPKPSRQPAGRTAVDQVSLDVPPSALGTETAFWSGLTEWEHLDTDPTDEFSRLVRPDGIPLALLIQRLDDEQPMVGAHLDLACDNRTAETIRHERLGATVVDTRAQWTVLTDPAGRRYCITDRVPGST